MANRFLKKYNLSSNAKYKVEDFELVKPINKSIKATQIYKDSMIIPAINPHSLRGLSQSPKLASSLILVPIMRPPKVRNHGSISYYVEEAEEEYKKTNTDVLHSSYQEKKPSHRSSSIDNRIHSQINAIRPPRHMIFWV